MLALALASQGERLRALARLEATLFEATAHQHPMVSFLLGGFALIQLRAGELAAVAGAAERILRMLEAFAQRAQYRQDLASGGWGEGWANYFLGVFQYERNDLEAAAQHWHRAASLRYRMNIIAYHEGLLGLALVAQAKGVPSEALAYAQAAREYAVDARSPLLLASSEAFEVRLALLSDQRGDALRRAQALQVNPQQRVSLWLAPPLLAGVQARLAEATPTALTAALEISERCLRQAETDYNTLETIQSTALQALVLHALRRTTEAMTALGRALALAEPGGFVRTFLDLGAPMAALLRTYRAPHHQASYVNRLLAAFAKEHNPSQRRDLTAQYAKLHGITPLTVRELELLALISQRRSLAEIAAALVIAPSTVKNHTHHIYTKLGVRNGRQAVAKAQELGLLPEAVG